MERITDAVPLPPGEPPGTLPAFPPEPPELPPELPPEVPPDVFVPAFPSDVGSRALPLFASAPPQ